MESSRRYKRFGRVFLLMLAVLVGSLGWLTYREVRQERLNRALFAAIQNNDAVTAIALLERGVDANARDTGNRHLSLLDHWKNLLEQGWGEPRRQRQDNQPTPLQEIFDWHRPASPSHAPEAIMPESLPLLQTLFEKGANIQVRDARGATPLMQATRVGYWHSVQYLLEHGADVNARDEKGRTALIEAVEEHDDPSVHLLLAQGADVNVRGNYDMTALMAAEDNNLPSSTVRLLVDKGAEVNAKDEKGRTALIIAIAKGQTDVVRLLLDRGVDVNVKDKDGQTALIWAVRFDDLKMVRLLISRGADVNTKDNQHKSSLSYAARNMLIISLLKQAGAKE